MCKPLVPLLSVGLLAACGGGSDSSTFSEASVMRVFADGSGIAKLDAANGDEVLIMASEIATGVANINDGTQDADDVGGSYSDLSISTQFAGYNIREGAIEVDGIAANVIAAGKGEENRIAILQFPDFNETMLLTYSPEFEPPAPASYEYTGLYVVGERYGDGSELGTVVLTGNFATGGVYIDAVSENTSLSGNGFIDGSSGRISGRGFTFISPNASYSATVLGKFGGPDAAEATGQFYTNDEYPDFAGAFAATK